MFRDRVGVAARATAGTLDPDDGCVMQEAVREGGRDVGEIIKTLQPTRNLMTLAKAKFRPAC